MKKLQTAVIDSSQALLDYCEQLEDYLLSSDGIKMEFWRCPRCTLVTHVDGKTKDSAGFEMCVDCLDKKVKRGWEPV